MEDMLVKEVMEDVVNKPHKGECLGGTPIPRDFEVACLGGKKVQFYSKDGYLYYVLEEATDTITEVFMYGFDKNNYKFIKECMEVFKEMLKCRRIEFEFSPRNKLSANIAKKYNFREIGTKRKAFEYNGEYQDVKVVEYINESFNY